MSTPHRPGRLAASQQGESGVRLLAERHGPPDQRSALRKDLGIRKQVRMGEVVWIVKDPPYIGGGVGEAVLAGKLRAAEASI